MRQVRDCYVLRHVAFERLYEQPWRGVETDVSWRGFDGYSAAKAIFDQCTIGALDDRYHETEDCLFLVRAKSKEAAIARLMAGQAYDKTLLHTTPTSELLSRRAYLIDEHKARDAQTE